MTVRRVGSRNWNRALADQTTLARVLRVGDEVRDELLWEASQRLDNDDSIEAMILFSLAAILWRDRPEGPLGVGVCHMKDNRIDDARFALGVAQRLDEFNPYTLSNLAECCLLQGELVGARVFLDAIDASADPRNHELAERLADLRRIASTTEATADVDALHPPSTAGADSQPSSPPGGWNS